MERNSGGNQGRSGNKKIEGNDDDPFTLLLNRRVKIAVRTESWKGRNLYIDDTRAIPPRKHN